MSKRTLATRATAAPTRAVHYIDPAPRADLVLYSPRQLAARRRQQAELYARWVERQHAIAERDRKVRRFLLGFGAVVGAGVLAGCGTAGWIIYHALSHVGGSAWLGALAVAAIILGPAALIGGHRCITVVKHWH